MVRRSVLHARQWKELWEEGLTSDARRRIRRAVWRGQRLKDPDEAAIAVELALREQRSLIYRVVAMVVVGLGIGMFLLIEVGAEITARTAVPWAWVGMGLIVAPILAVWRGRRFRQAERLNEAAGG